MKGSLYRINLVDLSITMEPSTINTPSSSTTDEKKQVGRLVAGGSRIREELGKVIVGQEEVIEQLLIALLAGGHCLITGAPGLAKTYRRARRHWKRTLRPFAN